jgi:DedD protein
MAQTEIVQDEQRLKQRAMRRLAIALVLIAGAIAGLGILDRYNAALKKPQVAPSPPEPRVLSTPPPTPTLPPSEKPPPPPPPVVSNQSLPEEPAPAPSAAPTPAPSGQPPSARATPTPPAPPATPQQPASLSSADKPGPSSSTAQPAEPSTAAKSAQTPLTVAEQPAQKGFVVQVGIFTSSENARTLEKKLSVKGIPARIETRVVVGPFQDRAEADAVVAQLRDMGFEGMVLGPH